LFGICFLVVQAIRTNFKHIYVCLNGTNLLSVARNADLISGI